MTSKQSKKVLQNEGFWVNAWKHFRRDGTAMFGLMIVFGMFLLSFLAPLLANNKPLLMKFDDGWYTPAFQDYPIVGRLFDAKAIRAVDYQDLRLKTSDDTDKLQYALYPPIHFSHHEVNLDSVLEEPGAKHWMGTDDIGRDVAARMIHGAAISLKVGFVAVGISFSIGVFLGAIAGYYGRWVDNIISRFIEVMMCFPTFFLILTVMALIEKASIWAVMIVIGVTSWTSMARYVRAEVLRVKTLDYSQAARALGATMTRIVFRHILPNSIAPVLVSATFGIASAILTESALSFLGFGVQPPTPTWGNILDLGRQNISVAWWLATFPGIAIFLAVLAYNLVGDGFRDAIDPRTAKKGGVVN